MDTTLLLQTLLFGAALYFLTGALLRRLFLRRLPLPPGPSGWPIVGCLPLLGTMPHISLANLAKKYGPLMYLKLGTGHTIVVSSPDVARTFLKTLDHNVANRPLGAGPNYIAYDASDMVFAELGPRWKLLRKLASLHMLGGKAFNDWAPLRHQEVGCMVRDIYKLSISQGKKVVPVLEIVSCALANIVGQKTLSQRVFTSHGEESTDFEEMITELMRLAGLFNIGDFIPSIEWMDLQGIQGRMKKLHAKFDGLITRMLEQHMATTADRKDNPDFFDIVMGVNAEEEGVVLNMKNYKALLLNLFISGSDTSACTVEWAMTELLKNPRMLKRLQEEIDTVVGKNRRLEESDLPNLPYLQAICNETFRRHPVVPLSIPRVSTVDFEANGYHIPKDSRLLINTWAIGRDPTVWDDPLEFKPERFLEGKNSRVNPGGPTSSSSRSGQGGGSVQGCGWGWSWCSLFWELWSILSTGGSKMARRLNWMRPLGWCLSRPIGFSLSQHQGWPKLFISDHHSLGISIALLWMSCVFCDLSYKMSRQMYASL